jgi:hypothetical protein
LHSNTFYNGSVLVCQRHGVLRQHRLILLLALLIAVPGTVHAQRFLRQGFSNNEDFGSELKLDENDRSNAMDMTREMFLMQDLLWQIQPPILPFNLKQHVPDPIVRRHIQQYMSYNKPIDVRLLKKRGRYGLRAVGRTANGKTVRAFWRQTVLPPPGPVGPPVLPTASSTTTSPPPPPQQQQQRGIDFLKASYDDACRSRLFTVEFELQLPPVKASRKNKGKRMHRSSNSNNAAILPSIVYQVALEPGSMNPKAIVPRTASRVYIYPTGRQTTSTETPNPVSKQPDRIEIGKAYVSATAIKPGIVDPSWAKGRPIFRKGRNSGLM